MYVYDIYIYIIVGQLFDLMFWGEEISQCVFVSIVTGDHPCVTNHLSPRPPSQVRGQRGWDDDLCPQCVCVRMCVCACEREIWESDFVIDMTSIIIEVTLYLK